jgi:uncharacterized membrane protein
MTLSTIVLTVTTVSIALITGLWYAYSCSVNPALHVLGDKEYLAAMQSINRVILNPVFFATFMGTLLLLPLSTWMHFSTPLSTRFILLLIASIIYIVGVFGITIFGNVPLNEGLDKFNLQASAEQLRQQREIFEAPWNRLHTIRTVASLASLVLTILGCLNASK